MVEFPVMGEEVIEAIHNTFVDNPDVEVDCYLFLNSLHSHPTLVYALGVRAEEQLREMNRCPKCGAPLQIQHYKEPHTEFVPTAYEEMTDIYCPNCDRSYRN